jgi:hypothetical protein
VLGVREYFGLRVRQKGQSGKIFIIFVYYYITQKKRKKRGD